MPIAVGDVKLAASAVMDDVDEGGGAPSATVIESAVSNEIFDDISELDRAAGRVKARKVFVSIQTNDTAKYAGGNVIVAKPPADPLVNVTLFTTSDVFDTRESATSRVEAYLNAGPEWPGFLYENHIEGQRSIQLFQRTNAEIPPVGRTLCLRYREGFGDEREQYVRITRVTVEERTFTYNTNQDYQANIITLDISDPLKFDFPGTPANRQFTRDTTKTITRDTVVADAATYYGTVPLEVAITLGDAACKAEGIYTQVVPNSRTETSLLDQRPSGDNQQVLSSAPKEVSVSGAPQSQRIKIGQENRGFNYVTILTPLPAPGTLKVQYRALGRWYSITDNGDGTMSGSGAGTVNYLTGSVSVTLQALPDDRSAVLFFWGETVAYTNRSSQGIQVRRPEHVFTLEKRGVEPNSLTITWTSESVVRTATDDGDGKITGDAVGEIDYASGIVFLRPSYMIDAGGEFDINYDWSTQISETKTGLTVDVAGAVSFTLASEPVPGSVQMSWITTRSASVTTGATSTAGSSSKTSDSRSNTLFDVRDNENYAEFDPMNVYQYGIGYGS